MALDFIRVNPDITPLAGLYGNKLVGLVEQVRATIDKLDELKDRMDHMNVGSNFGLIETTFGLPADTGQIVYDMLNGISQALRGQGTNSQAIAFITRVG